MSENTGTVYYSFDEKEMKPTKAQIGRAGELFVQQKLLLNGIDSSPLTTDYGIDLVAFSHRLD
jgi:hypothetical protein